MVDFVDSNQRHHTLRVQSYDAFHEVHRALVKLMPEHLRGWLKIGVRRAAATEAADKENARASGGSAVEPLPLCVHRASIRQLIGLRTSSHEGQPSRPPTTILLGCYGEVETWLRCSIGGPAVFLRLPNLRVVCRGSLQSQGLAPVERAVRSRFPHLPERVTFRWHRAVMSAMRGPDMATAVELRPTLDVLSCELYSHDTVLVAELVMEAAGCAAAGVLSASLLTLIVQRLGGDHLILTVDGGDSIAVLKRHLHDAYGVPFDSQQLFIRQQQTADERLLSSYLQPPEHTLTLLLASPAPLLISAAAHRPVHLYSEDAVSAVRRCMQMPVLGRRTVRGWTAAECAEWLEDAGGRVGRLWEQVRLGGVKGVSATGLTWVVEDDEERERMNRWTQSGGASAHCTREVIDVNDASTSASSRYLLSPPPSPAAADPLLPVVEVIDLNDADVDLGAMRRRGQGAGRRAVSAPAVLSPEKRRARKRKARGHSLALVDLVEEEDGNLEVGEADSEDVMEIGEGESIRAASTVGRRMVRPRRHSIAAVVPQRATSAVAVSRTVHVIG